MLLSVNFEFWFCFGFLLGVVGALCFVGVIVAGVLGLLCCYALVDCCVNALCYFFISLLDCF